MKYNIIHYPNEKRFTTTVDGYPAYLEYILNNDSIDIIHTVVHPAIEGMGVAAELVKSAYEFAKKEKLKIIPSCSYVKVWLKRNSDNDTIIIQ